MRRLGCEGNVDLVAAHLTTGSLRRRVRGGGETVSLWCSGHGGVHEVVADVTLIPGLAVVLPDALVGLHQIGGGSSVV